jgi:ABC-type sugar transport system ATPase subunit
MITIDKLSIRQGDFLLSDIELTIPTGDYGILMGPTGCGKTSLLESICGLRRIAGGQIMLDELEVTKLPPSARQIGYVPQDSALFPTMRVDQQIAFALEIRKFKKSIRAQRVSELAELLDIKSLLHRFPVGLSGGEKQRVALARALSFKPRLLCLDEPLSSLDDATRTRMAALLRTVHQRERVTVLHITHNAAEAHELGTIHFRLEDGRISRN